MRFKIPKMSYKQKTLRNIVMMILLFVFVWMNEDCPMPTAEINFRRFERKMMLEPSEIVLQARGELSGILIIGRGENYITAVESTRRRIYSQGFWTVDGGEAVKLIPVGYSIYDPNPEENGPVRTVPVAAALDMPEETYRAELFVECEGTVYRAEGEKHEGGVWLFSQIEMPAYSTIREKPYELLVYDAQNHLLLRREGAFPKSEL